MAESAADAGRRVFLDRVRPDTYLDVIRCGLEYVGFGKLVGHDTRVFVKPNLTFPEYRRGVMTSPACVEAALVAIREYTPHVRIGDSDSGGYNPFPMEAVYEQTGIVGFARTHGVELVNLTRVPRRTIDLQLGRRVVPLGLPRLLTDETDVLVTLPVPKIHMNTHVSLSYKNQWGCIPEPTDRLRLHPDFAEVVLAVNDAVHAKVAIVDGMYGLNRSGPMAGDAVELGWLLVAEDLGAAARACCALMQVPLRRAPQLRLAERRGRVPVLGDLVFNQDVEPFVAAPFTLRRKLTDYPGLFAFRSRMLAHLGYFSPLAGLLHKLLYVFRKPFYDYTTGKPLDGDSAD
ncbi:MAG: DUF362 domain-containing protein [Acidimicrobiales bacterium]